MKKTIKILNIAFIIFMLIITYTMSVIGINIDNISNKETVPGGHEIKSIASYIYSGLMSIGIVLSVVILAILGVKYMLGSASERAEYKKSMMPYLIGAVLVFSASTIATVIYHLAS